MTLTLFIAVNVALAAAIVVMLAVVMTSLTRLAHHQPAAWIPAPRVETVATDVADGPGLTHVSRPAQSVLAPAPAAVRT